MVDPECAQCAVPIDVPCLVAHVVNVPSEPAIEWEIAVFNGVEWANSAGQRLWPFWHTPIYALLTDVATITIPPGWLDYLHSEATLYAASHRAPAAPRPAFLQSLLASRPRVAIPRRGL